MREGVRTRELLELYDLHERSEAVPPHARRETTGHVVRHVSLVDDHHYVIHSSLDAASADDAIHGEIAYFAALGAPFEWKYFGHDRPADLLDRLVRAGFRAGEEEAVMVLDLAMTPSPAVETGAVVRRLPPGGLGPFERVVEEVWPDHARGIVERLTRDMGERPDMVGVYVVDLDGAPVSAGWTDYADAGPFASLRGGATLEAHRGRGCYRALVARRVADAARRGMRYVTVDAGAMSQPVLARLGFEQLTVSLPCTFGRT